MIGESFKPNSKSSFKQFDDTLKNFMRESTSISEYLDLNECDKPWLNINNQNFRNNNSKKSIVNATETKEIFYSIIFFFSQFNY